MKVEDYKQISRGYVEVDLSAIKQNVDNMLAKINPYTQMVLVIKTDGYGHGAVPIARNFDNNDRVWGYAVATSEEAIELRDNGIVKPIMILGYVFPYCYEDLARYDIRPAVFREDTLEQLNEAARKVGKKINIHIKVDTGMSRIGIFPDETGLEYVKRASAYDSLCIEGIFTHMSRADEEDKTYAYEQIELFKHFTQEILDKTGIDIPLKHCSNSAGIIEFNDADMDMVRAGITLYGLWPSDEVSKDVISLKPALSLKSHIVYLKKVKPGTQISYGGTYVATSERLIATIPIGYGDGYPRSMSEKGYVLIRGHKAYICGRVCMDQLMVDVTDIEGVSVDDVVTFIGKDNEEMITAEAVGEISGKFNYELVCGIGKRIPRVYILDGEVWDIILDRVSIK